MVQIENQSWCILTTPDGERALTNSGVWTLPDVSHIWAGTNDVELPELQAGAVILVDAGGAVSISDGPRVEGAVLAGFALAISTIGIAMAVRWAFFRVMAAGRIVPPGVYD